MALTKPEFSLDQFAPRCWRMRSACAAEAEMLPSVSIAPISFIKEMVLFLIVAAFCVVMSESRWSTEAAVGRVLPIPCARLSASPYSFLICVSYQSESLSRGERILASRCIKTL